MIFESFRSKKQQNAVSQKRQAVQVMRKLEEERGDLGKRRVRVNNTWVMNSFVWTAVLINVLLCVLCPLKEVLIIRWKLMETFTCVRCKTLAAMSVQGFIRSERYKNLAKKTLPKKPFFINPSIHLVKLIVKEYFGYSILHLLQYITNLICCGNIAYW